VTDPRFVFPSSSLLKKLGDEQGSRVGLVLHVEARKRQFSFLKYQMISSSAHHISRVMLSVWNNLAYINQ
jgi:hypothetical protein